MASASADRFPELPYAAWHETYATLHLMTQLVGKLRLELSPMMNGWWQVTLYLTARGLTTSPLRHGERTFEVELDFLDHAAWIRASDGTVRSIPLFARPVAEFYRELKGVLRSVGLDVALDPRPQEIPNAIPCDEDTVHAHYDPVYVRRWFEILRQVDVVFKEFRARFTGKASPVHFFWGSFDLAVTRFSGRRVPVPPGLDLLHKEDAGYEEASLGFWPGSADRDAAFYAYALPPPEGYGAAKVAPATAIFDAKMGEFFLPYDDVRRARHPEAAILDFAQSTYDAAARLGNWDPALERITSRAESEE